MDLVHFKEKHSRENLVLDSPLNYPNHIRMQRLVLNFVTRYMLSKDVIIILSFSAKESSLYL